jgi:hypothetical protein
MNWWDILKQKAYEMSDEDWNRLQQPTTQSSVNQQPQGAPQQDYFSTQQQTTTRKPIDKTPQYDPTKSPSKYLSEEDMQAGSKISEAQYNVQPTINTQWATPQKLQTQTTQYTGAGSGAEDSGTDDTDVGTIRENVNRAKQNLTQLPRGPKALQITQILTDLSAAAIDPVNQKNIVLGAKKKLQDAFPQVA